MFDNLNAFCYYDISISTSNSISHAADINNNTQDRGVARNLLRDGGKPKESGGRKSPAGSRGRIWKP